MTKEKLQSLNKYRQELLNKLSSPLPVKHKNRQRTYHQFLNNELKAVTATLEKAKLEGNPATKA